MAVEVRFGVVFVCLTFPFRTKDQRQARSVGRLKGATRAALLGRRTSTHGYSFYFFLALFSWLRMREGVDRRRLVGAKIQSRSREDYLLRQVGIVV